MREAGRGKKYKYLIFDADHTLLNYHADERAAFQKLYEELGMPFTEERAAFSRRASEEEWTAAGMYDVHSERIQKRYHALYREHVVDIFKRVFERYPCPKTDVTFSWAAEKFLKNLESVGRLMDGAETLIPLLSQKYALCIATNGLSGIQRGRLADVAKYFQGVYISEEVGVIKPLPAFFAYILQDLHAKKEECLMIGDSLTSDMAGAKAAGIDCCWFSHRGQKNETGFVPDYEILSLFELNEIL